MFRCYIQFIYLYILVNFIYMKKKVYTITEDNSLLHLKFLPPYKTHHKFINDLCVLIVVNGSSLYYTSNGSVELNPKDIIVFNNDNFINTWKKSNNKCEVIIFKLTKQYLNELYKPNSIRLNRVDSEVPFVVFSSLILNQYINSLRLYLEKPNYLTGKLMKLKVEELIYLLSKEKLFPNFISQIDFDLIRDDDLLDKTVKCNLFNPINIEEFAFLCNMSLSTFQRKFKNRYNTSPAKYIEKQRVEKAKLILSKTTCSITDVCYQVGFESLSHFSKVFKKNCGVSPSDYRKTIV